MRRVLKVAIGAVAAIAMLLVATAFVGRYLFEQRTNQEIDQMFERAVAAEPGVLTEQDIDGLPGPVQRWLQYSGVVGRERPASVRLKQEGEIRLAPDQAWMPFTADQYYTTNPPALIWRIKTRMMKLLPISGRDMYQDGRGNMEIRVLSVYPVVDETGPEMDQGTLLRYLNETMWFPAGAVSPYITWDARDENSAVATMSYEGVEASATFYFDDEGRITNMMAHRFQDAGGGEFKFLPWWTPVSDYGEFDGVRIPVAGEGVWEEDWGNFPYVRIRIQDIEYNVPEIY